MSEACRLRRGEGYEACSDDKQEKAYHVSPQCGYLPPGPVPQHPPSGGASRAFGLPQAAAKRFSAGCRPHPLTAEREKLHRGSACGPLCAGFLAAESKHPSLGPETRRGNCVGRVQKTYTDSDFPGVREMANDNKLITLAVPSGYPPQFLVWCRSAQADGAMPIFMRR